MRKYGIIVLITFLIARIKYLIPKVKRGKVCFVDVSVPDWLVPK